MAFDLLGRGSSLQRLLVLGLLLTGLGLSPRGCEAIECHIGGSDPGMDSYDQDCGDSGCFQFWVANSKRYQDCAFSMENPKCLHTEAKAQGFDVSKGNCLVGEFSRYKQALAACGKVYEYEHPELSDKIEVCHCLKDKCNNANDCKCKVGGTWPGAEADPTTKPPGPTPGHASTVSTGEALVVTFGTLMILYAWKGS